MAKVDVAKAARLRSALSRYNKGWETRRERDERAAVNVDPEMLVLWERTKGNFKGSPDERAEQFAEYAEEHPGEFMEALEEQAERQLSRLIAEREGRLPARVYVVNRPAKAKKLTRTRGDR